MNTIIEERKSRMEQSLKGSVLLQSKTTKFDSSLPVPESPIKLSEEDEITRLKKEYFKIVSILQSVKFKPNCSK
jgi:hypothetical protein